MSLFTSIFVATGRNDEQIEKMRNLCRSQIAFYASTRVYHPVLEVHGWEEIGQRLTEKAAKGDWKAMAAEITDEMLDVFTVTGSFADISSKIKQRYDGLLDRFAFYFPYERGTDDDAWRSIIKEFNG